MQVVLCPHCRGVNLVPGAPADAAVPCGHCTRPFTAADPPPPAPPADRPLATPVLRDLPIIRQLQPGGRPWHSAAGTR